MMRLVRFVSAAAAVAVASLSMAPAQAQFFFKSKDLQGEPVRGDEPGIGVPLPGATDAELRASLVWNLRSALNVAALQCDFAPTLFTTPNYNAVIKDHDPELDAAMVTLQGYFNRTTKTKKAAQAAFDHYGTVTYASFSTVLAQRGFCQTASNIGRLARLAPRGSLNVVASERMRELRNSLVPYGEQTSFYVYLPQQTVPQIAPQCWRKGEWNYKKCPV